jgi:hypothetical protein
MPKHGRLGHVVRHRRLSMRFVLKLLALLIFGPIILGLLLVLGVVAVVGIPLLWEELMAKMSAPRNPEPPASTTV